jgi:hypothetical protein
MGRYNMPSNLTSPFALGFLKQNQADAMDDLCNIYSISYSSGTYSTQSTKMRTLIASGVICGIVITNGQVMSRGQVQFVEYDAVLRVVDGQTILSNYEFDLIEKGNFQISGTFKVWSQAKVNSSVQKVLLQRVVP